MEHMHSVQITEHSLPDEIIIHATPERHGLSAPSARYVRLPGRRNGKTMEQRIEQLEQLCNDLFNHVCAEQIGARVNMQQFVELSDRMDDLGLMEEFHD